MLYPIVCYITQKHKYQLYALEISSISCCSTKLRFLLTAPEQIYVVHRPNVEYATCLFKGKKTPYYAKNSLKDQCFMINTEHIQYSTRVFNSIGNYLGIYISYKQLRRQPEEYLSRAQNELTLYCCLSSLVRIYTKHR